MEKQDTKVEEQIEELVDYEESRDESKEAVGLKPAASVCKATWSTFRDFLLKPELLRAITESGYELPSEVQQEAIPQAIVGTDIICQAKSGMGKTAVFVLSTLQTFVEEDKTVDTLVLCHARELAYQVANEYRRFGKYLAGVRVAAFFGGLPVGQNVRELKSATPPTIVVGTPGRIWELTRSGYLNLGRLKRFVVDECDCLLGSDMRSDVQRIFMKAPLEKQVMMFSATLSPDIKRICKKFTNHAQEIYVDEVQLVLHGLKQFYCKLEEKHKNRKLSDLLDALEFNQIVIFVNGKVRAQQLSRLLCDCNFPAECIHGDLDQAERLKRYESFKTFKSRILVSTDLFGRGMDFERINVVVNYDMPTATESYLHRVGRSGRFGTKGLAVSFVANKSDSEVMESVQGRFEVEVPELPHDLNVGVYL